MEQVKKTSRKDKDNSEVVIVGTQENQASKQVAQKLPSRAQPVMSFDTWWMTAQYTYKLASHLKKAVYNHFKARGFLESRRYDEGIKDFGC
jgi:hypothetical protein